MEDRGWGASIFSAVKSSRTGGRPGIIAGKCYYDSGNLMGTDGEYCRCSLKWWILKSPWFSILQFALTWMIWSTKTMESCIPFTSINASNSMEIYHHSKLFPIYCQWQETMKKNRKPRPSRDLFAPRDFHQTMAAPLSSLALLGLWQHQSSTEALRGKSAPRVSWLRDGQNDGLNGNC